MTYSQHDIRDCVCIDYKPDFMTGELRLTGDNFYCSKCIRYVSSKKWRGGLIKLGMRVIFKEYYCCPCCGERMRRKRRRKNQILKSIDDQTKHPENYTSYMISKLKVKQDLIENNILIPTVT